MMKPLVKLSFVLGGAVFLWLWDKEPKVVAIIASAKKEDKPTEEELRKVMSHLGKRSGKVRGRGL